MLKCPAKHRDQWIVDQRSCSALTIGPTKAQDQHLLCAIGHARVWRRRMEDGQVVMIQELAEVVGSAERHVSHQLQLDDLTQEMLKQLTCRR